MEVCVASEESSTDDSNSSCGARTRACRAGTHAGTCGRPAKRPHECGRGTHECVRHACCIVEGMIRFILALAAAGMALAADADLILHNGKIVTVDAAFSIRQAVAVKDGRIVAAGSDADILKERGAGTEVIDLKGRTALPGLIDAH